ncbi:heavy-metal-associated domain-containing protein [Winogradskyella eckloniae]|uniref:cation transporter n=1 Tax=Winogradskyella eckloniae TaxID=1089306 RepID=UPI0015662E28|nr:heavy metal-associated domain-containing protein [Winogradskyella eckloniae]NRD18772.1 heavy-metal-associated domain-containing protein [Winogradskyella eckloniae]
MNTFKRISIIAILTLVITSCKNESKPEVISAGIEVSEKDVAKNLDPNATYAKVEFGIEGMTCAMGCAKTIEKKMAKMDGVKSAKVDFDKRLAMVEYDEAKVSPNSLEETVGKVAKTYKVKDMRKVEAFGAEKKACCANKTEAEKKACKESCANKTEAEKKVCKENCKEKCCSGEKKMK